MNREQLIEKAHDALIDDAWIGHEEALTTYDLAAIVQRVWSVFEEAHAPTCAPMCDRPCSPACVERHAPSDDEREALRNAFDEMHRITEGGCDTEGRDVAEMVIALGFRCTVQGEPNLPSRFSQVTATMIRNFKTGWHQADMEGDAGNRVKRGLEAVLDAEPQAEPTDAQVLAALSAYYGKPEVSDRFKADMTPNMRAALRAAAEAEGGNR